MFQYLNLREACVVSLLLFAGLSESVAAEAPGTLRFANVLNDSMVLQQEKPVRVWGWADPGAKVTVMLTENRDEAARLVGEEALTRDAKPAETAAVRIQYQQTDAPAEPTQLATLTADAAGLWVATLKPLAASFTPKFLVAASGDEQAALVDVLVGEVWLCSGQSNMELGVGADTEWTLDRECTDFPAIRCCTLRQYAPEPLTDLSNRARWQRFTPADGDLGRVSAIAFHFALRIHQYLKVPVGLVCNAVGGSLAESWTSRAALETVPQLQPFLEDFDRSVVDWPAEKQRRLDEYEARVEKAKAEGKEPPRQPRLGDGPLASRNAPGACFNGLIAPLSRLVFRGALYHQGENNSIGKWNLYEHSFPKLIECWRETFGDPELPFGILSLPGFGPHQTEMEPELTNVPTGLFWYAAIRDVHLRTSQTTPHTGLITTFDLGDTAYIHPARKRGCGQRAARWALATVYGKPIPYMAPLYREAKVEGNRMKVYFDVDPQVAKQKKDPEQIVWWLDYPISREGKELRGFVIAGADRHFYPAHVVRGKERGCLEVWSDFVPQPAAVRYGWAGFPDGNAVGIDYLPVHPFRTDHWPLYPEPPLDNEGKQAWGEALKARKAELEKITWQRKLQETEALLAELQRQTGKLLSEEQRETFTARAQAAAAAVKQVEEGLSQ